jgi:hypothetical protein
MINTYSISISDGFSGLYHSLIPKQLLPRLSCAVNENEASNFGSNLKSDWMIFDVP